MGDYLFRMRKMFDEDLEQISQIEDATIQYVRQDSFMGGQWTTEFAYLEGLIEGKIMGLGLMDQQSEIRLGMRRSSFAYQLDIPTAYYETMSIKQRQNTLRVEVDALRRFCLDYVDRFAMYNKLFGEVD